MTPQPLIENTYYKRCYEDAYAFFNRTPPKTWEELTDEERQKVADATTQYHKQMNDFGDKLREGSI